MGLYLYSNPENENEVVEIIQSIHDKHEYSKNGKKWHRVFTKPNYALDTQIDPYNSQDFVKATNKKGKIQDLFDRSREASEKRKDKDGKDLVKEKYMDDWEGARKNKAPHPERKAEQQKKITEKAAKAGFDISF